MMVKGRSKVFGQKSAPELFCPPATSHRQNEFESGRLWSAAFVKCYMFRSLSISFLGINQQQAFRRECTAVGSNPRHSSNQSSPPPLQTDSTVCNKSPYVENVKALSQDGTSVSVSTIPL